MADEMQLQILRLGTEAWNGWYGNGTGRIADLDGAGLSCLNLAGVNLSGAKLRDSDLRYTDLTRADLRGADLSGAKLGRAILCGARLEETLGLTQEQLHYAEGDQSCKLPRGLWRPFYWSRLDKGGSAIAEPSTAS